MTQKINENIEQFEDDSDESMDSVEEEQNSDEEEEGNDLEEEDQNLDEQIEDEDMEEIDSVVDLPQRREKRRKPGIIYLSSLPPNMNVSQIREYFLNFGKLGRVFLKSDKDKSNGQKKKKKGLTFIEGWIEFKSKRKAKQVVQLLNRQPVGGKKKNMRHDELWNMKYLPRFKWAFLCQQLEHQRELHRQRLNAEVAQVRRETDHYVKAIDFTKKKKEQESNFVFRQNLTEEEKLAKKEAKKAKNEKFKQRLRTKKEAKRNKKKKKTTTENDDLLGSVFTGNKS